MNPPGDGEDGRGIGELTQRFRVAANLLKTATAPHAVVTEPTEEPLVTRRLLPVRYLRKEDDDGPYLTCVEASNIKVRIERGLAVTASAARKYPKGTIFLDGAAQGEPFIDAARGIYNLDHHEACVRSFTLATCEQAMVVIMKGLDLEGESWTVYGNEPDLDTVLAVWMLLNHRRIADEDPSLRRQLMPLVRLQGVIDGHGLELTELAGLPEDLQETTLATINSLRAHELELKRKGRWESADLLDFTAAALQQIDELYYTPGDFEDLCDVEELGRVWISSQRFALACRSEAGIYEVEEHLRALHGERLGLLILQKTLTTYTLRQTDTFLPTSLGSLYERLNLFDSSVDDGNRWGGSDDIGGSPRASGTPLSLGEIMGICRWVFQRPSMAQRLVTTFVGVSVTAVVIATAVAAGGGSVPGALASLDPPRYHFAALVLLVLGVGPCFLGRSRFAGHFGMRRPRGYAFLFALPLTVLAALAAGVWLPLQQAFGTTGGESVSVGFGIALVLGVVGIEILLRGALHGWLVTVFPIMLSHGRHFISVPNAVAAVVYTVALTACFLPPTWLASVTGVTASWMLWCLAGLGFGLLCGAVRERWGSLWAPVLLHALTAVAAWLLFPRLL